MVDTQYREDELVAHEPATRWPAAMVTAARLAAPAILGYVAARVFGLLVLWWWATREHADVWRLLGQRFDAIWYVGIAQHGYDAAIPLGPNGLPKTTNLAFFPLYPALMRAVATIVPVSLPTAGLIISWVAALVAAWGIFMVGNHLYGRRAGILLTVVWGVLPHSVVESMAYTETLFTALAAWSLYALLRRQWLTAGALCTVAGLSRATALALAAAIGVAAGIAVWRRRDGWRPLVAVAIAPLGFLAYVAWVALRLHRIDGWFYVQSKIWGSSFDGGRYTFRAAGGTLVARDKFLTTYVVTLVLAVAAVLLVLSVLDRQPWPVLAYSAAVFAMTAGGAGYYHSKARLLLPAFTLLLPIAAAAERVRLRNWAAILAVLAASSAWFGGYLALIWPYSP